MLTRVFVISVIFIFTSKAITISAERRAYVTVIASDATLDAAIVMGASLFASTRKASLRNYPAITTDYVSLILPRDKQLMNSGFSERYCFE